MEVDFQCFPEAEAPLREGPAPLPLEPDPQGAFLPCGGLGGTKAQELYLEQPAQLMQVKWESYFPLRCPQEPRSCAGMYREITGIDSIKLL